MLKDGVIIVNTADRHIVDEEAIAEALISKKIDSYVVEGEDLTSPPLGTLENVFMFKGFGWFTQEALETKGDIWINNIEGLIQGNLVNPVS